MSWFDDLKSEVLAFFEKATEKDIQLAFEKSNYAFYKDIDVPILDFHERLVPCGLIGAIKFGSSFTNRSVLSAQIMPKGRIYFKKMGVSTSADNYGYALAA